MDEYWVEDLVKKYSKEILQYLSAHTYCREDAEDLFQEVFTSCYKARESFDPERCGEQAWLYILARNRLKNYYRDHKINNSLDDMEIEISDHMDVSAQAAELTECREMIAKALQILDERSRMIIVMRFFDKVSCKKLAYDLGTTEGNVRVIQNRALRRMEKYLKEIKYIA